jgi:hypothetical protein
MSQSLLPTYNDYQVKLTLDYNSTIDLFRWNINGQLTKPFLNDKLTLSLGLRFDANSYNGQMNNLLNQFSPRFSASYGFTKKWFLNFNAGRNFKYNREIGTKWRFVGGAPYTPYDTLKSGLVAAWNAQGDERCQLRHIPNSSGTILPSTGIMVDF